LEEIAEYIDWSPFFWTWSLKGKYPAILKHPKYGGEAEKLFNDAQVMLKNGIKEGWLQPRVRLGIMPAYSEREDVVVLDENNRPHTLPFTRQQLRKEAANSKYYCLSDFIAPKELAKPDHLGVFVVSSGWEYTERAKVFEKAGDDYSSIIVKCIGDRVAEALAEWAHLQFRRLMGSREDFSLDELIEEKYSGIRPAPGYPSCPDHKLKEDIWQLLGGEKAIGAVLTESLAMDPPGTVAGFMFQHPEARYFPIPTIAPDQIAELARHRGLSIDEMKKWIAFQT
jgi:5-methyltetrahydrofolate--homocysteine methyltransferase